MAQAIVPKIGPASRIVRPKSLQAIIYGILPLSLSRRNRAADNGCTDAEANSCPDVAATSPSTSTAAPASTASATTLRVGRGNT